jgi:hypothetical protein
VAARNVAGLMRQNADDFARCFGFQDHADVDEHPAGIRNEGVECLVVDEDDRGFGTADTGHAEDRFRIIPQETFHFRIANQRQFSLGVSRRKQYRQDQSGSAGQGHRFPRGCSRRFDQASETANRRGKDFCEAFWAIG